MSVANPVIPPEIGRCLRAGENIVQRQTRLQQRKPDFDDLCSGIFQNRNSLCQRSGNGCRKFLEKLSGKANPQAFDASGQLRSYRRQAPVGHIPRILSRDRVQQRSHVFHAAAYGSDLIKG